MLRAWDVFTAVFLTLGLGAQAQAQNDTCASTAGADVTCVTFTTSSTVQVTYYTASGAVLGHSRAGDPLSIAVPNSALRQAQRADGSFDTQTMINALPAVQANGARYQRLSFSNDLHTAEGDTISSYTSVLVDLQPFVTNGASSATPAPQDVLTTSDDQMTSAVTSAPTAQGTDVFAGTADSDSAAMTSNSDDDDGDPSQVETEERFVGQRFLTSPTCSCLGRANECEFLTKKDHGVFGSPRYCRVHGKKVVCRVHLGQDINLVDGSAPRHKGPPRSGDFVGTPVVAADDGVVTFAGPIKKGGGGIAVKIQDSRGCVTEYMHLNQVNGSISVGDHVRRGTDLGEMGRTGDATGTHLHFGLECNGKYLDPVKYMIPRSTSQLSMSCRDLINSLRGYSSDDEAGGGARPGHTRNSNVTN